MRYSPKKDPWALCVFTVGALVLIGVGVYVAMLDLVAGVSLTMIFVLFLCSTYFWAGYEITSSHVAVRLGPVPVSRIRLDEIVEAAAVSSISATAHFALSSEAIRIVTSRKIFGVLPPTTSISPRDRTGFLQELAAASPNLELCDNGVVRHCETSSE